MATLVYSDVDGVDRSFALGAEPVTVGRGAECAIRSDDPRVSRVHARFFVDQGALWVEDLGSSNGIFVGPNRVQRAPVPTGEIILVGSLLIRLLPASGTLPPPIGLHGTLASWLDMERKVRATIEEERDAFARRVGEMHHQLSTVMSARTIDPEAPELMRAREEAEARAAALEHALATIQDELAEARDKIAELGAGISSERVDWAGDTNDTSQTARNVKITTEIARMAAALEEAEGARSIAEHAHGEAMREAQLARDELVNYKKANATEIEAVRIELGKARESRMMAETAAGVAVAERLAEADLTIAALQREIADLRQGRGGQASPDGRVQDLADRVAALTARAEKADKDLASAQIRAQGSERNLSGANAAAAKAETRAAQLEEKLGDADKRAAALQRRLDELSPGAGQSVAPQVARSRDDVAAREAAENAAREAERRADDAEKRASAADTMAKAMAKDVAEALRRAAEADTRARGVSRDLSEALRRAEQAEARTSAGATSVREIEQRASAAEARVAELEQALTARAEQVHQELAGKLDQTQKELGAKLEQAVRELAAERSTSLSLVDRKTQLERELAEARAQLPGLSQRAEDAEHKLNETEAQLDTLQDRIDDLESGIAVAETAGQASVEEVRGALRAQEVAADEARDAAAKANELIEQLRSRLVELEGRQRETDNARAAAEAALVDARSQITELENSADERAGLSNQDRDRLAEAVGRANDAERKIDALAARAEAADLAIGRAGALQRQLDEALSRLAWLEREQAGRGQIRPPSEQSEAVTADRIAAAEDRVRDAETRAHDAEARARDAETRAHDADARAETARDAEARAQGAEQRAHDAEAHVADAEHRAHDAEARARNAEARIQGAEARIIDAEHRADAARAQSDDLARELAELQHQVAHVDDGAQRLIAAEQRAQAAEGNAQAFAHQVAEMQNQIAALEREVANADNVRSFAAETEREIASLQRDVRDARAKLAQMTLERDRLSSELHDARGDDADTTSRRAAVKAGFDPDVTAQVDIAKYESLAAKTSELEQKVQHLERDDAALRRQLADAEERLRRSAIDLAEDDNDRTRTGGQLPIAELTEHVTALEESINSLRANMRAASDETAMMDPSESVNTISTAVSQAAEHVETARAAIRALAASIGLT